MFVHYKFNQKIEIHVKIGKLVVTMVVEKSRCPIKLVLVTMQPSQITTLPSTSLKPEIIAAI